MPESKHFRQLLTLAWPLVISNSFWNLQMTIDRVVLGQLSTEALAASGAVMGIFWAPMALLQQTAAYTTTFVAQAVGGKQLSQIGHTFWQASLLCLLGGIAFFGLIPLGGLFFPHLGHAPRLVPLEMEYFNALCWSAFPTACVAAISGVFSGVSKTHAIIYLNGIGFLVNAVLDVGLVFGKWGLPALGVAGAGYATAVANAVSAALGFFLLFRNPEAAQWKLFSFKSLRADFPFLKNYLKFALPSGLQWALEGLALTAFMVIIGRMPNGETALAASSLTLTVMMLGVLPPFGIAQAGAILVGQKIGEAKPREGIPFVHAGILIAGAYIFSMALTFFFFPEFYLNWFRAEDAQVWAQVLQVAPDVLKLMSLFILFDSINLVVTFALKGAGDTAFVSWIALILPWPLLVLPTWWVHQAPHGLFWAWAAGALYAGVQATVFWFRFKQGSWMKMNVLQPRLD